jgi:hypothetical protein
MTWTWADIRDDWLAPEGARLAHSDDEVLAAFETVEAHFGRDWIEASRREPGIDDPARGAHPTLVVTNLGNDLSLIEGARNVGRLLEKLRDRDSSARAELAAASLLLPEPTAEIEFEPVVAVGDR